MKQKKKTKNTRRRSRKKSSLLMVNARTAEARKQRLLKLGSLALPILALAVALWVLVAGGTCFTKHIFTANDHYIINNLDIRSDGKLRPVLIKVYAEIDEDMNLFAIDIGQVRENLENIPIVKDATVWRDLPDTLKIRVIERVALAQISDRSGRCRMTVDCDGILLTMVHNKQMLPSVTGLNVSGLKPGESVGDALFQNALQVLDLCDRTRLNRFIDIENIDISDPDFMEVMLKTGEYVLLPHEEIKTKLVDLANTLGQCRRDRRTFAKLDLTGKNVVSAIEY